MIAKKTEQANMLAQQAFDSELAVIQTETELAKAKVMVEAYDGLLDLEIDDDKPALSLNDKMKNYVESLVHHNNELPGPSNISQDSNVADLLSDVHASHASDHVVVTSAATRYEQASYGNLVDQPFRSWNPLLPGLPINSTQVLSKPRLRENNVFPVQAFESLLQRPQIPTFNTPLCPISEAPIPIPC